MRLAGILKGLGRAPMPVVLPLHPRTQAAIRRHKLESLLKPKNGKLMVIEPLGYLDTLQLQQHAAAILTDSGGIQKEAYYLNVPCITLRDETEWVETVATGWNQLVGADPDRIQAAIRGVAVTQPPPHPRLYGDGHAAERMIQVLGADTTA